MGSAIRESRSVSYYYLTVFLRLLTHTDSRTRGQQTFRISSAKMDLYLSSFFSLQIIRDWNRLPPAVTSVSPMESFRTALGSFPATIPAVSGVEPRKYRLHNCCYDNYTYFNYIIYSYLQFFNPLYFKQWIIIFEICV